jgi:hypothetical protein
MKKCMRGLADALLAVDDPRGELIQCQLDPTRDYQRRAMRLVQQHGLAWTGALRGAVIPLAYERGFLASCQALDGADKLAGAIEWSTVGHVELQTSRIEFLLDPIMRSLHTVSNVSRGQLGQITSIARLATIVLRSRDQIVRRPDGTWAFPAEVDDRVDD